MADDVKDVIETQDNPDTQDDGGNKDTGGQDPEPKPMSFDDFLKSNKDYQAEFDRRVSKATNTAVDNAQKRWQMITDEKVSEAEKLAKMTKDERDKYNFQKREKDLEEREKEITRKELRATAKNALAEKELPLELAELLDYTDAKSCNQSIESLERAFQSAVASAVNERLKGTEPMKKAPENEPNEEAAMKETVENAVFNGLF